MWSCTLAAVATNFARQWRRWSRGSIQRNSFAYIDRGLSKQPTLWNCNPSITKNLLSKCRTVLNTAPVGLTQTVSSAGCRREGFDSHLAVSPPESSARRPFYPFRERYRSLGELIQFGGDAQFRGPVFQIGPINGFVDQRAEARRFFGSTNLVTEILETRRPRASFTRSARTLLHATRQDIYLPRHSSQATFS